MTVVLQHKRALTNSGDFYTALPELWKAYWEAVEKDKWDTVMAFETGQNPDFRYDP
jgi:hypothetical protein